MIKKTCTYFLVVLLAFAFSVNAGAAESADEAKPLELQLIAGAGPSTKIVILFAKKFSALPVASGYRFVVPPRSAKHAGGIANSDEYIFGRTGRPLNQKEKAMGKDEIILARIPIAFAVGNKAGVSSINFKQLKGIITGEITNWSAMGGADAPIEVIGREPTEALFSVLKKSHPFFKDAKFGKVVKKDTHVVNILKSHVGDYSIGFGARPNFGGINILEVAGFSEGVSVGLVYDLKNSGNAFVVEAVKFAASKDWADRVQTLGVLPPQ